MDRHRAAVLDGVDEPGHDGRVLRVRVLPRPEDVEVAQRDRLDSVDAVEADAVALRGQLRDGVGRDRVGMLRLGPRQRARVAVDRRGGGEDDAPHVLVARGEEDVQGSLDRDRARRQRILDRARAPTAARPGGRRARRRARRCGRARSSAAPPRSPRRRRRALPGSGGSRSRSCPGCERCRRARGARERGSSR